MQQMWAKESEFRAFLQSTGHFTLIPPFESSMCVRSDAGAEAKGLTMDDFKQLPAQTLAQTHFAISLQLQNALHAKS